MDPPHVYRSIGLDTWGRRVFFFLSWRTLFFSFPGGLVLCPITIGTGTPGKEKKKGQGPCFCSVPGCDLLWILAGTAPGKEKKKPLGGHVTFFFSFPGGLVPMVTGHKTSPPGKEKKGSARKGKKKNLLPSFCRRWAPPGRRVIPWCHSVSLD